MNSEKQHWENIYRTKSSNHVSWYAPHLKRSLDGILKLRLPHKAKIIDVGGGASTLPDDLLTNGFQNITILDISAEALKVSKDRLGKNAEQVSWLEADVRAVDLGENSFDLWHDRAVFHFLTHPKDRSDYIRVLNKAVKPDGYVLIATFGLNGPLKCSGLDIVRYSPPSLQAELGNGFKLRESFSEIHKTPFDTTQEFVYCHFQKV